MPTLAGVKFNTSGVGGFGGAPYRARKRTRLTKSEALRACKSDVPAERVPLRFLGIFRILRLFRLAPAELMQGGQDIGIFPNYPILLTIYRGQMKNSLAGKRSRSCEAI
ncbi:MAG: hypothetical protein HDS50_00200 [Bacteroides sp.]|nr:hypothetical protein [Bacteroides sp.]